MLPIHQAMETMLSALSRLQKPRENP
jgi:hypothetical protein